MAVTRGKAAALEALGDEDKAVVEQTTIKTYVEEKPKENTALPKDDDPQGIDGKTSEIFNNQINEVDPNTLIGFAQIMSFFEGEPLILNIVRLADFYGESFNVSCESDRTLRPMPFHPGRVYMELIPMIQQANSNSGGRFNIDVVTQKGEQVGAGLFNFSIPDPVNTETSLVSHSGNQESESTKLILTFMERSDKRFEELSKLMRPETRPKSPIEQAMEAAMIAQLSKVLSGESGNVETRLERTITDIFTGVEVSEALGKRIASRFNSEDSGGPQIHPMLAPFATEANAAKIINGGLGLLDSAVKGGLALAASAEKKEAVTEAINTPSQPQETQINYEETIPMQQKLADEIIAELESDRPLDQNNEFLKQLRVRYPLVAPMLEQSCKTSSFEDVVSTLEALAPDAFKPFYVSEEDDAELTERGQKIMVRLEEFYNLLRLDNVSQ